MQAERRGKNAVVEQFNQLISYLLPTEKLVCRHGGGIGSIQKNTESKDYSIA